MKIIVNPDNLTITLETPNVLSAGSEVDFTIEGATGIDASTANVWIFSLAGGPLAFCETITEEAGIVSGTLSTKFDAVKTLFTGCRPDQRKPVVIAVEDNARTWGSSSVEMVNKPSMEDSTLPIPTPDYVTREELAALGQLGPDVSMDDISSKVNEILSV